MKTPPEFKYNEGDYRSQSRRALLFGHNLLIHHPDLQNKRFALGLDQELQECVKAFTEIWGHERNATQPGEAL